MAGVPSALLGHVYTYLLENGFTKAAKVLRKSAGEVLCEHTGPGLMEFFNFYLEKHTAEQSSLDDGSASTATSVTGKKRKRKSERTEPATDHIEDRPRKRRKKGQSSEGEGLDEVKKEEFVLESKSDDDKEKESVAIETEKKKKKHKGSNKENVLKSEPVEADLLPQQPAPPLQSKPLISQRVLQMTGDTSDSSSDEENIQEQAQKNVTFQEDKEVCVQDAGELDPAEDGTAAKKKKRRSSAGATPFKRVTDDVRVDPRLQDNSFEAKLNSRGSWGEKANRDLKFTKGKSFRHEKTKKKRGTYKGGAIDTSVCSIKFDSD